MRRPWQGLLVKFSAHDVIGGITTQQKCESCDYKFQDEKVWRGGGGSQEQPLYWRKRAYAKQNTWDVHAPSERKFEDLIRNAVALLIADAQRDKIVCKLAPYEAFIPTVDMLCNAGASDDNIVVTYSLASQDVACGDLANQKGATTYEGDTDYAGASCTNASATFQKSSVTKTVVVKEASRRRLGTDSGAA